MKINDIYMELKGRKLCRSGHEFSRSYLGKHSSYLSVLKARGDDPSIETWAMLSYALERRAQWLAASDNEFARDATAYLQKLQRDVADTVRGECASKNAR